MSCASHAIDRRIIANSAIILSFGLGGWLLADGNANNNQNDNGDLECIDPPSEDPPACCCADDDGNTVCQDASWGCLQGWFCPSGCAGPVDNCPDDCPADGACCYPDISCDDNSTPTECDDNSGNYQGDGTACGEEAICCLPDGSGLCGAERCCIDELEGGFQSGLACNATGNDVCCCLGEDVYLSHAIDACCEYAEGESVTTADGTCGDVGACCMGNGDCFETAEACCPGTFLGAGAQCGAAAACCLDNGGCIDSTSGCCEVALNGEYDLPGKVCIDGPCGYDEVQACCLPDGGCLEILPDSCLALLGSPLGSGSTCSPQPQVCCFGTSCEVMDPQCCVLQEGVVHDETSCSGDPCDCSVDLDIDSNNDGVIDINDDSIEEVSPGKYIILHGDAASMSLVLYPDESGGRYKISYPDNLVVVSNSTGAILQNGAEFDTPLNDGHDLLSVTGLQTSTTLGDVVITVEQDCDNDGNYDGHDTVVATVISVDLDVDSDNTNDTSLPDRSPEEDDIEDDPNLSGKYIAVNRDNDDDPEPWHSGDTVHERIDDYIDGFNLDRDDPTIDPDNNPGDDNHNPNENDFIPITVEISGPIDVSIAKIRFDYNASDPNAVTINDEGQYAQPNRRYYSLPDDDGLGSMRIWTKPGHEQRDSAEIGEGDYVSADTEYSLADLGIDNDNRAIALFVEGISHGPGLGKNRIRVELDPDGPGPLDFIIHDAVRWTIVDVSFSVVDNPPIENYGFDDSMNPRCLLVPLPGGSTNTAKVSVGGGAAIRFRSIYAGIVWVPSGPFTGTFDLTMVSGDEYQQGAATVVQAYVDTPDKLVVGQLRVHVLPRQEVTIQFHKVTDMGHASIADEATAQAYLDFLNEAWGAQTNIFFKAPPGHALFIEDPQLPVDLGEVIQAGTPEINEIIVYHNPAADCDVYLVWNVEYDAIPDDDPNQNDVAGVTIADMLPNENFIAIDDDTTAQNFNWVIAHEIGHFFGKETPTTYWKHLEHLTPPFSDAFLHLNLMTSPPAGWKLTGRQAINAQQAHLLE